MQRLHSLAERCRGRFLGILCLLLGMAPVAAHAQSISDERIAAALRGLEDLASKTVEAGGVPGLAIAVVHNDKVVYLKGFGRREAGKPDMVDADTVFQLASMSKPLSSTVVAGLVGEGSVDWDPRICISTRPFSFMIPTDCRGDGSRPV